jgi:hypothetical protein
VAIAARSGSAAVATAGRYLALPLVANLAWEVAQMPLYTLWSEGSPAEVIRAVPHCTAGDGVIGAAALGSAWLLTAARGWPAQGSGRVAVAAVALEWLNVEPWRNWAYAAAVPRVPPLATGLSPILQWLLLPPLCLLAARRLAGVPGQAFGRLP